MVCFQQLNVNLRFYLGKLFLLRSFPQVLRHVRAYSQETKQVKLKLDAGTIIGEESRLLTGASICAFKGIPYAQPPLGQLRFLAPQPLHRFSDDTIDCRNERDGCFHRDLLTGKWIGSENCLHLNVFTPTLQPSAPLPVMVWIHGGRYTSDSGHSDYYSPEYLVEEGVIVVTLNYRLNVFGFLALPEADIYGNAGLKDQRLALKWIQQNINHFGGNADNVTLFGESAGGSCVHIHLTSPASNKYFHKVIMQSGTGLTEWSLCDAVEEKSIKWAKCLGFESKDQRKIAEYLRSIDDYARLVKPYYQVLTEYDKLHALPLSLKPTVEWDTSEAVLVKKLLQNIKEAPNSLKHPIMMGYNTLEATPQFFAMIRASKMNMFNDDLGRLVPASLIVKPGHAQFNQLVNEMRQFYFDGKSLGPDVYENLINLLSDYHFVLAQHLTVAAHATYQQQPLYFYHFSIDKNLNFYKKFFDSETMRANRFRGAFHGDDIYYLFVYDQRNNKIKSDPTKFPEDFAILKKMCRLWTNFAKYGNPTPKDSSPINETWLPVERADEYSFNYLSIHNEGFEMKRNLNAERVEFWRKQFDRFNNGCINQNL